MAYDERLESRIRDVMEHDGTEYVCKYMFGGVAFMVGGRMTVGIVKDDLMVKVGAAGHEAALRKRHVRPMDFTGKPSKGMVYVAAAGIRSSAELAEWVRGAVAYAASQPVREATPKKMSKTATTKRVSKKATTKATTTKARAAAGRRVR